MRIVPAVLGLLLVTTSLVGCLGDEGASDLDPQSGSSIDTSVLSEPRFDVLDVEVLRLEMADGQTMHNAIYRPDTNESVPVFINFSPYWGDTATQRGDAFAQYMIEHYVPRGYAVVLSAIRGTGHSDGCFQIGGDKEISDLKDTVEHFANADWSNGKVIAGGKSYDSTPQNGLIAKDPPKGLAGLFHVSGISDMYRYTYRAGVPYDHGATFNTYYYLQGTDEYGVSITDGGEPTDEDPNSLSRLVDDAACPEFPEIQANGVGTAVTGQKTDYWIERDWVRHVNQTDWDGSIFFVHGLQDWNVKPDHILPWLDKLPEDINVKGWLHQDTWQGTGHVYPMRADWNTTMLAWMDHIAKDKDTGIEWGFEVEGSDGVWRESESWPPADVEWNMYDLNELTGYQEGTHVAIEAPVKMRERTDTIRAAGVPNVTVPVHVDGTEDPVFTAVMYKEAPNGTRTWINEAVQRGLYRNGLEEPEPWPRGEVEVEITLEFYPMDDVLEPGYEWVVVLGDIPRYAMVSEHQMTGVEYDTHGIPLYIPHAPLDTAVDPQPEPIGCFAC